MINWLKGSVIDKNSKAITLNVNGVGYLVFVLSEDLLKINENDTVALFIHTYQRETGSELYGFSDQETRQFFEQLISISGVGPKGGLGILEQADAQDIKKAVVHGDPAVLTKVSGIGKKTAERIIVELKSKIIDTDSDGEIAGIDMSIAADSVEALIQLGYTKKEARDAMRQVAKEHTSTEDIIREALKILGAPKK
ncbi:Holliday junction branch migration protein RuvA [Patescibacteria group bacterium]